MHFYINAFIDCCDFYLGDAFQARATAGSLSLGYCCAMNQALRIPIAVILS